MAKPYRVGLKIAIGVALTIGIGSLSSRAAENCNPAQVPGTVVYHLPASNGIYVGSPGIVILDDGSYLAKCDEFGPARTEVVFKARGRLRMECRRNNVIGAYPDRPRSTARMITLLSNSPQPAASASCKSAR